MTRRTNAAKVSLAMHHCDAIQRLGLGDPGLLAAKRNDYDD